MTARQAAKARHQHYPELDALRGLAALSVVFGHNLYLFLAPGQITIPILRWSPLYLVVAAHEAVMLFFVLSGFVLSFPYLHPGTEPSVVSFAAKRVCRIYLPYLVALSVALLLAFSIGRTELPQGLHGWFKGPWHPPIELGLVVQHVLFLGSYDNDRLDPVIWSLVHELRISLLLPFLYPLLRRLSWRADLCAALACSVIGIVATELWRRRFGSEPSLFRSVEYLGDFIFGFVLARHHAGVRAWMSGLGARARASLFGAVLLVFCYAGLMPGVASYFVDVPISAAAGGLILAAIGLDRFRQFLLHPVLVWTGRVSYSLYLLHALVLLAFVHLLIGHVSPLVISLLAISCSLIVAQISYRWIERPSIELGSFLAKRIGNAPAPAVAADAP